MKKLLVGLLFGVTALSTQANTTLRVGMETTYAPYEYYNDKNELVGFDVDIANRICEILNYKCDFRSLAFESLIASLKMRRVDITISGMDITPERAEQIDFSTPYYDNLTKSANFVITTDSDITSVVQLSGKKVGVQNGTTHQKYLIDVHPEMNLSNYNEFALAISDLKNGRVQAVLADSATVDEHIKADGGLKVLGQNIDDKNYFGSGLGIGVRKGNTQLLNKINGALEQMKADGSYQKIYDKWFK